MEDLFDTSLRIGNETVPYHIFFRDELYHFQSRENGAGKSFSFSRDHDAWHEQSPLPDGVREEAIKRLEEYLLRQH